MTATGEALARARDRLLALGPVRTPGHDAATEEIVALQLLERLIEERGARQTVALLEQLREGRE